MKINLEPDGIKNVLVADNFIKRFKGFMFCRKPRYDAIIFMPCNSIHTFFMKFNIDVLFINDDMIIIKKIENLKPGKVIMPVREAQMVIEAKAGTLINFREGNKIIITSEDIYS